MNELQHERPLVAAALQPRVPEVLKLSARLRRGRRNCRRSIASEARAPYGRIRARWPLMWGVLGRVGACWGVLERIGARWALMWGVLGRIGAYWSALGAHVGRIGAYWSALGAHVGRIGAYWSAFGTPCGSSGRTGGSSGYIKAHRGASRLIGALVDFRRPPSEITCESAPMTRACKSGSRVRM